MDDSKLQPMAGAGAARNSRNFHIFFPVTGLLWDQAYRVLEIRKEEPFEPDCIRS